MKKNLFLKTLIITTIITIILIITHSNEIYATEDFNEINNIQTRQSVQEKAVQEQTKQSAPAKAIDIKYEYNSAKTQVVAKIVSTTKLKNTKPTWKLSDDKLTYTKVFTQNQTYETGVEDVNGKKTNVKIEITQIAETKIDIKYEYNTSKSQVTVKMVSNRELKNTKPTWSLSKDKLTYTKVFTQNQTYTTGVEDINGKKMNVKIGITQIQGPKINIKYEYNTAKSQVTVRMVSDRELKHTKPTWNLSKDKLTYTKVFSQNQNYSTGVEDIYGHKLNVNIKIDQIGTRKANISVKKEYNSNTNQVTVKIVSDMELKNTKPTWNLSKDKLTYTKVFTQNQTYQTPVQDINGHVINVRIDVNEIRKAKISTKYIWDENTNKVTAQIVSDIKLKNTKPTWSFSKDGLTYTKVFDDNTTYKTGVEDINGNSYTVEIKVTQIDKTPPEIKLEYKYNTDDSLTVYMKSNEKLKHTKPTWKLSADKLVYEKTFNTNQSYTTTVQDSHGVETSIKIDFKIKSLPYKQDDSSTIKVRYLYIGRQKAIVEIISSIKMKDTKPTWKLSADGYTYTKEFYNNEIYGTSITDINGKTKDVHIIVNLFDNYLAGIDVSAHQGKINWAEVKNAGIDFAILRCGYGQDIPSQDDTFFARNVSECERLGIPYGVYLYSYALTEEQAISEANHVLRLIKGHNPQYGVWIDMEDADGYKQKNGMPSNETLVNICATFCNKLIEKGYKTGIYANTQWLTTKLNSTKLDKYQIWVAQWNNVCTYNKDYKMWQYTSKGKVNGILTSVDMDIYYK